MLKILEIMNYRLGNFKIINFDKENKILECKSSIAGGTKNIKLPTFFQINHYKVYINKQGKLEVFILFIGDIESKFFY